MEESVAITDEDGLPPKSMMLLCEGVNVDVDCNRDFSRPSWLDIEKFKRGQKFALEHLSSLCIAELISLLMIFSFESGLKPLKFSGKSSCPFSAFKRYHSTIMRVKSWYETDIWDCKSEGGRNISTVRSMHRYIFNHLKNDPNDEVERKCNIESPCCPLVEQLRAAMQGVIPEPSNTHTQYLPLEGSVPVNQTSMAITQFAFIGIIILYPEKFGVYCSSDELDDLVHVWAGIGYLLGIEDRFNFCLGGLSKSRERTSDFLDYFVRPNMRNINGQWEHMCRCLTKGTSYYVFLANFEALFCYMCWVLDIPRPSLTIIGLKGLSIFYAYRFLLCSLNFYLPSYRDFVNSSIQFSIKSAANFSNEKIEHLAKSSKQYLRDPYAGQV